MKTIISIYSLVTLLLLAGMAPASQRTSSGIAFFNGTLKEAVTKAKAEKKFIFFDAYASWCGPCKAMEAKVFPDEVLGDYFNQHFISIRIDMEKGEGPDLAKRFTSIDGYPSLLFLNSDGHVVKTLLGSRGIEELLAEAKLVK
jgi:thioredoxin 1